MSAPTTDELLVAAGRGDRSAFAHLYDRSAGDVYAGVRHLVPDPVAAERVVTDIWLEVWRTAGRFDPADATATQWVLARAHAAIGLRDAGHEALEPVELCRAGRFTYRDVAELFGEQPGAIAVRIRDGLRRLRDDAGDVEADGARRPSPSGRARWSSSSVRPPLRSPPRSPPPAAGRRPAATHVPTIEGVTVTAGSELDGGGDHDASPDGQPPWMERVDVTRSRLARVLAAIAAQPDGGLPARLCAAAALELGAAGVALSLATGGDLHTAAATDGAREGQELLAAFGEGPAIDSHRSRGPVLVADLASYDGWSAFTPAALERGYRAVFSFPLRSGAIQLGALTLYRFDAGDLDDGQHADALMFAQVATDLLVALQSEAVTGQLHELIVDGDRGTWVIHQATGMVAAQCAVGVADGLALLRAHAYAAGRPLAEVAADVVARQLRLDGDNGGRAAPSRA